MLEPDSRTSASGSGGAPVSTIVAASGAPPSGPSDPPNPPEPPEPGCCPQGAASRAKEEHASAAKAIAQTRGTLPASATFVFTVWLSVSLVTDGRGGRRAPDVRGRGYYLPHERNVLPEA